MKVGKLGTSIRLSRARIGAQNLQFTVGWQGAIMKEMMGDLAGSGRQVKRACGLCVCLTGALMEVMSFVFWVFF